MFFHKKVLKSIKYHDDLIPDNSMDEMDKSDRIRSFMIETILQGNN